MAHRVAVEACRLELAQDHAEVLLAEVLSPVPGNRDDDAGFVAEATMARCLAAEFGKAVIDQPGRERPAGDRAHNANCRTWAEVLPMIAALAARCRGASPFGEDESAGDEARIGRPLLGLPTRLLFNPFASLRAGLPQSSCGGDVHGASEQVLQLVLQGRIAQRPVLVHIDQHVEIAGGPGVAASHGSEDSKRPGAMSQGRALDLVAASPQRLKVWDRPGRARVRYAATAALDLTTQLAEPAQVRIPIFSGPSTGERVWPISQSSHSMRAQLSSTVPAGGHGQHAGRSARRLD
jgi:hypothetical protein